MAEQKQRRVEEVAPGLVRIVDGDTYVYLSSSSADLLAEKWHVSRANAFRGETVSRSMSQTGALHA